MMFPAQMPTQKQLDKIMARSAQTNLAQMVPRPRIQRDLTRITMICLLVGTVAFYGAFGFGLTLFFSNTCPVQ